MNTAWRASEEERYGGMNEMSIYSDLAGNWDLFHVHVTASHHRRGRKRNETKLTKKRKKKKSREIKNRPPQDGEHKQSGHKDPSGGDKPAV
ncbi:hypothetical protein VTK73DRAFT_4092 [Phialemonium thermophilum]|uniref:Uncharacterized protein n=1 Tax=Phialemonium thermophilum TaxID=223376 RepID=A0ABR3VC00_9PEZI